MPTRLPFNPPRCKIVKKYYEKGRFRDEKFLFSSLLFSSLLFSSRKKKRIQNEGTFSLREFTQLIFLVSALLVCMESKAIAAMTWGTISLVAQDAPAEMDWATMDILNPNGATVQSGSVTGTAILRLKSIVTPSITITKNIGAVTIAIGTLKVENDTLVRVDNTTATEVVFTEVNVEPGMTLTIESLNNGKLTIGTLNIEGMIEIGDPSSVVVTNIQGSAAAPVVSLSAPTGTGVTTSATDLVLALDRTVSAIQNSTVTIVVDGTTYTYTVPAAPSIVTGVNANCIATIPFSEFKNGVTPLTLEKNKNYQVGISAGVFEFLGKTVNTANANVGNFTTISDACELTALTGNNGGAIFALGGTTYSVSVANATASITLDAPTVSPNATYALFAASGEISPLNYADAISLAAGAPKTVYIVITAQDGVTKKEYTITITRAASGEDNPDPTTPVTGVTLNPTTLSLTTGGTSTLTATVAPSSASNKNVTWKSSDTDVATVDANGKITAVGPGTCTITVTTADGGKKATCEVTVTDVPVTGVTLNRTTLTLKTGQTFTLTATVAPDNATNKNVTWSSGNANFATVDQNGRVTGVAAGTVVIAVKTGDGEKTATCTVTVTETEIIIDLSDLGLENGALKLEPGQEVDMTIVGTPAGLKFQATGLPDGLTLTEDGRLTGKVPQVGKYPITLTVTAPDGTIKTASFTVEVTEEEIIVKSDGGGGGCNASLWGAAFLPFLLPGLRKRAGK